MKKDSGSYDPFSNIQACDNPYTERRLSGLERIVGKLQQKEKPSRFLTPADLAYLMKLNKRTIYNQISAGTFPIKVRYIGRLPRVLLDDYEAYVQSL